jgi:hypothetical protein
MNRFSQWDNMAADRHIIPEFPSATHRPIGRMAFPFGQGI